MYCSNCGNKLQSSYRFCPQCGMAKVEPRSTQNHRSGQSSVPSVGRRISVVLYLLSYLGLVAISVIVGLTIYQSLTVPDPQTSFVTCRSGSKITYKALGIRNPITDVNHDNLLIDAGCRNLGGNTYTNVMRRGQKESAWQTGLAVFAGGLVVIEVVKGMLAYLIKGHFPAPGSLGRR